MPETSKNYVKVTSGLSQILDQDDPEFEFPISTEMHLREGRYTAGDEIGRGAMKKVLLSDDKLTARKVAQAKLLDSDNQSKTESFFREARITAQLQHPNIVPVYDAGYDREGKAFFTMKPVGKTTLKSYLKNRDVNKNNYQQDIDLFIKICHAIAYAHSKDIVHLDLKPENIYLGEFAEVLVGDWGLARSSNDDCLSEELILADIHSEHTQHDVLKGTPGYMAPEQIEKKRGKRDHLCDVYSLGAILYEIVCGRGANTSGNVKGLLQGTLSGDRKAPREINESLPLSLESVVLKALETEREKRYPSVQCLIEDLKKFQGGYITSAEERNVIKSFVYLLKRHQSLSVLIFLLLSSSIIFSCFLYWEKQKAEAQSLIAIEQKNRAEKAFEKQAMEQAQREAISKAASPRLVNVARTDLVKYDYDSALANARLAVLWDPDNNDAKRYLARILLITQGFNEANALFKKIDYKSIQRKKTIAISARYAAINKADDTALTVSELKKYLKDSSSMFVIPIKANEALRFLVHIANYAYGLPQYSLDEKMEIASLALELTNPVKGEIKYSIFESQVDLDFSGNKKIYGLEALHNLPIRRLNISNSSIKSLDSLMDSSVKELDMRGCSIQGYSIRLLNNLEKVFLSPKQNINLSANGVQIIRK
ncbi:protein kinase [Lentisphaera profundi]|uniref:Protein kinase n=1 Tax=Lentisphaera profundi TaxID=1658616 RepID=A0ABY7VQ50_9BACT|nr:serine/threonine-protein kinase [Lentisphaera profundi]WDE96303.1 protein kinase [Lentisphaera profundi]